MAPKTTGKPSTTGRKPSTVKSTYKTTAGSQQYVRGATADERLDTLYKTQKTALRQPRFNKALSDSLSAATSAENSRTIKGITGEKRAAAPGSTVKMYDRFEKQDMARARKALAKKKSK
jgi:hypothetical protein